MCWKDQEDQGTVVSIHQHPVAYMFEKGLICFYFVSLFSTYILRDVGLHLELGHRMVNLVSSASQSSQCFAHEHLGWEGEGELAMVAPSV